MHPARVHRFFVHMFNLCQSCCNVKMLQYIKNSSDWAAFLFNFKKYNDISTYYIFAKY
jgi:hypothetical protein